MCCFCGGGEKVVFSGKDGNPTRKLFAIYRMFSRWGIDDGKIPRGIGLKISKVGGSTKTQLTSDLMRQYNIGI